MSSIVRFSSLERDSCDEETSHISSLPDELLLLIFSYLYSATQINVLPYVCSHWKTNCYLMPVEINFSLLQSNVFRMFSIIESFNNVTSLKIDNTSILHVDRFPLQRRFTKINKLSYTGNNHDYGRNIIVIVTLMFQYFKELTSIKLEYSHISISYLETILSSNENITSINLWQTRVDMGLFTRLIENGALTSVKKLKYNSFKFKKYRYVEKEVCDQFFIAISKYCPNIEWLDVRNTGITEFGLMSLKECVGLKHLNIKGGYKLKKKMVKTLQKELPTTLIIFK